MTKTITLRLDDETHQRLSSLAETTDRSKTYLTTQALETYLANQEWQIQAIQEAVNKADTAKADDFVDHDKVVNWLDTWGTEDESKAPF